MPNNYGDKDYWDQRYKEKSEVFEWLESWGEIKDVVENHCIGGLITPDMSEDQKRQVRSKIKVLNVGCGNAVLPEDMYDDGYRLVYNMDFSDSCIKQMSERNIVKRPEMIWETMDARDLAYPDGMFDLVIDKGTVDAMMCSDFAEINVAVTLKECQRVLKDGGIYLVVSYST